MQYQNNRWDLVAKKLAGKASDEEKIQLQAILDNNPYLEVLMIDLSNLWSAANENNVPDKINTTALSRTA